MADYKNYLLKPSYLKAQDAIIKRNKTKVVCIYRQKKITRDWLIRNNLLQIKIVR